MTVMDHKAKAQSRVYAQYRAKPKAYAWYGITGQVANELEQAFSDVATSYDIGSANTNELDIIGRIVVIDRGFKGTIQYDTYQVGACQSGGLGVQLRPLEGVTDSVLNNDIYRLLIRSKISKNTSDATLDGIVKALSFIVSTDDVKVADPENMSFFVSFDSLTDLEKTVLANFDITPKPQGVRFAGFIDRSAMAQVGAAQVGSSQLSYSFGV